jgi:hypothetical protein
VRPGHPIRPRRPRPTPDRTIRGRPARRGPARGAAPPPVLLEVGSHRLGGAVGDLETEDLVDGQRLQRGGVATAPVEVPGVDEHAGVGGADLADRRRGLGDLAESRPAERLDLHEQPPVGRGHAQRRQPLGTGTGLPRLAGRDERRHRDGSQRGGHLELVEDPLGYGRLRPLPRIAPADDRVELGHPQRQFPEAGRQPVEGTTEPLRRPRPQVTGPQGDRVEAGRRGRIEMGLDGNALHRPRREHPHDRVRGGLVHAGTRLAVSHGPNLRAPPGAGRRHGRR